MARAASPSLEERLEILQQEIDEIKAELARRRTADGREAPSGARADAATAAPTSREAGAQPASTASSPPAPAPTWSGSSSTTLGSYGEINYNHALSRAGDSRADLRRFVMLLGHRFDDRLSFYGELELEHAIASQSDSGEFEAEQAFLDYRIGETLSVKAGLFLMPVGLLNETHEPTTYHGVERNEVETRIIPTTWREGGIGLHGSPAPGWDLDAGLVTGFDAGKYDDQLAPLASMHQELQQSRVRDGAVYAAANYRAPGLQLGGAVFSGNTAQGGASAAALTGVKAPLTLWDLHARYQHGDLELRALYARGHLGDADRISAATGIAAPSRFYGWYTEAAYQIWQRGDATLTPFVRYERFDTQAGLAPGFARTPGSAGRVTTVGIDFKPRREIVFKADYQSFGDSAFDRFNLGLGWYF
jgi:Phosphate-selective porin O and P